MGFIHRFPSRLNLTRWPIAVSIFALTLLIACGGGGGEAPAGKKKGKKGKAAAEAAAGPSAETTTIKPRSTPHPDLELADQKIAELENLLAGDRLYEAYATAKFVTAILGPIVPADDPKLADMKQIEADLKGKCEALFDKPEGIPAKWPRFKGGLNGEVEVKVVNPNDFRVRVGVGAKDNGVSFVVPPKEEKTILVPNGVYEVFMQFAPDPINAYKDQDLAIRDKPSEIQIVKVISGNYALPLVR